MSQLQKPPSDEIGVRLRKARELRGLSQTELALRIGVAANTVSGWEKGERMPRAPALRAICEVCRCTADFILGRSDHVEELPVGELLVDVRLIEQMLQARSRAEVEEFIEWVPAMVPFWFVAKPGMQVRSRGEVEELMQRVAKHVRDVAPEIWESHQRVLADLGSYRQRRVGPPNSTEAPSWPDWACQDEQGSDFGERGRRRVQPEDPAPDPVP